METALAVEEGKSAPDFTLPDDTGKAVTLSQFRGRSVVLYFYPADDTPGCTAESCSFRDHLPEFDKRDTVILGISPDGVESHVKFKQKFSLPFPLLADTERKVATAWGVFGPKTVFGRETMGIVRSTFVIGPDGVVKKAFRGVKVDGHTREVLAAL